MIAFRHAPPGYPFLWEGPGQPAGRWNREGDGPTHYFADTPDGAWAEFLRHEEITDPDDLPGIERAIWAVEIGDPPAARPGLRPHVLTGDRASYPACQRAAGALRAGDQPGLTAPSAALVDGDARGLRVDGGLKPGPPREAAVIVIFGARPDLAGWCAALGRPAAELLARVRHFTPTVEQPRRATASGPPGRRGAPR